MIKAKGNGQSECFECKRKGKWSLTWTDFLYKIKNDNFQHLYCYEHAKELENRKKVKIQMYEITYSMNGVIKKIDIKADDAVVAQSIFTNMFGGGAIEIINVVRK